MSTSAETRGEGGYFSLEEAQKNISRRESDQELIENGAVGVRDSESGRSGSRGGERGSWSASLVRR